MTADEVMALIRASDKPHYVYALARPDGSPLYIGAGSGRRCLDHERVARNPAVSSSKVDAIRALWSAGEQVSYEIHGWFEDKAAAFEFEARLVAEVGRMDLNAGPLTNMAEGGAGARAPSAASLRQRSASLEATWSERDTGEATAHLRAPEVVEKAAAARRGRPRAPYEYSRPPGISTAEQRRAASERLKADPVSRRPGVGAKISAAKLGVPVPNHWTKQPENAERISRGAHPRARPVLIDGQRFGCILDAAAFLGVSRDAVARALAHPDGPRRGATKGRNITFEEISP